MMVTHPLTITSNIMLSRSHMVNTKDWHPSYIVMATPLKSCESSHWCSVIIINVIWKSPHSVVISHSPLSHKIILFDHTQNSWVVCNDSNLDAPRQPLYLNNIIKQSNHSLIMIHISSSRAHLRSNHLGPYLVRSRKWWKWKAMVL